MKFKNVFLKWLKWRRQAIYEYSGVRFVGSLTEIPANTDSIIFIVNDGDNKWVVFMCPNKCGKRIEVNLMKTRYPRWRLKINKNKITISPSIIVDGCNAHFWLTDNKVYTAFDQEFS